MRRPRCRTRSGDRCRPEPDRLLAPVLDLLGVLPADDAFAKVDPSERRQRTHDALRQVFLAASVAEPLCVIVEDLHWIDGETQAVLDRLVNGISARACSSS